MQNYLRGSSIKGSWRRGMPHKMQNVSWNYMVLWSMWNRGGESHKLLWQGQLQWHWDSVRLVRQLRNVQHPWAGWGGGGVGLRRWLSNAQGDGGKGLEKMRHQDIMTKWWVNCFSILLDLPCFVDKSCIHVVSQEALLYDIDDVVQVVKHLIYINLFLDLLDEMHT